MKKKPLFVSVIISLMLVILTTHSASRRTGTLEGQDDEWELIDKSTPHQLPARDSGRTLLEWLFRPSNTADPGVTSKPAHMLEAHVKKQLQKINTLTDEPKRNAMQATTETQTTIPQMQGDSQKIPESPIAQPKNPKPKNIIKRQTAPVPQLIHAIIHSHTTRRRPGKEYQLYSKQSPSPSKQTVVMVTEQRSPEAETRQRKTRSCPSSVLHCLKTLMQWD